MKRTYRITLVIEQTFDRKAIGAVDAARGALVLAANGKLAPGGWMITKTRISSSVRPERMPPAPRAPDAGVFYDEIANAQALDKLREIGRDMAAILGNVKKPRFEYSPNAWCDGVNAGARTAHAHNQKGVRWVNDPARVGKRAGRKIPFGLICLNRRAFLVGHYSDPANWPELVAHELMHLRMPGGSHGRAKYIKAVGDLVARYADMKGGQPGPKPPEAHE
jgi:hypothetical protein